MRVKIDEFLTDVEKPLRYLGKEWNCSKKTSAPNSIRIALAFPDTYEIGMSHIGLRILYALLNQRTDIIAERVFAPWGDMEQELRRRRLPLFSLETHTILKDFDIIGFSLQYEMNYTNVLNMLDLAELPLRSSLRTQIKPLIIAGGPAAFNPEPLADFIDLFAIGDGEEIFLELIDRYKELKTSSVNKKQMLKELSSIEGIYVPSHYATKKETSTGLKTVVLDGKKPIRKRIVFNLDSFPFPDNPIVPYCQLVHDRICLEIARGCRRRCRFCQAGEIYLPERERNPIELVKTAVRSLKNSGYDEVSLSSLSPGDYSSIGPLTQKLMSIFKKDNISLSISSIRPSKLDPVILEQIRQVRKTGFTLAPEAGTQRLRDVINKGINEEEILSVAENVFKEGWQLIKLYFMIGLPTEQLEDIEGIVELTKKIISLGKKYQRPWINLSASTFIPKPHSAFQWLPMERLEHIYKKQNTIKKMISRLPINFKKHNPRLSFLEGVFSRGDRSLAQVLERAWQKGCRFDGWGNLFRWDLWMESFQECDISPEQYLYHRFPSDSQLPWDHISTGVKKEFLINELELGLKGIPSITCSPEKCDNCGVCPPEWIKERKRTKELNPEVDLNGVSLTPNISSTENKRFFYRASLEKKGDMKYLSHLDFSRTITRAFRRANLPMVFSQGFHPKPQISFSPALALGIEAEEEFIDFVSYQSLSLIEIKKRINSLLPSGLKILRIALISKEYPSLEQVINIACYSLRIFPEFYKPICKILGIKLKDFTEHEFWKIQRKIVADLLRKEQIVIKRRKKGKNISVDIRPSIHRLYLDMKAGKLNMELRLNGKYSAKPFELIKVIYPKVNEPLLLVREKLLIFKEGKYYSSFGEEVKYE